MNRQTGDACVSALAFSMPMIAFVIALGIGLFWAGADNADAKKESAAVTSQSAGTDQ